MTDELFGASIETEQVALQDNATGKPIVMRVFDFALPPFEGEAPTKEQLIAAHKTSITGFLWRDELVLIGDMKLVFTDKENFKIFCTCQAKAGSVILEKTEVIQTLLNGKSNG